jgi:hypothetical protein
MHKNNWIIFFVVAVVTLATVGGCTSLNPDNFLPPSIIPAEKDRCFDGTVNVQTFAPLISRGKVNLIFGGSLGGRVRVAVEQALAQKGLFQRIEQGDADYVLDIWITDVTREIKTFGEGYIIDMTSIWRLTRSRDGNVMICDFANGHGASRAVGTNAFIAALETTTRGMILKGLSALSDRSTPLAALYMAQDWPSMGPAIPQGYKKLKEDLPKLHAGLTEDEVGKLIPSMANAVRTVNVQSTVYASPVYNQIFANGALREVPATFFPFQKLVFMDGRLMQWELNK